MSAMVESYRPPHRKPLPQQGAGTVQPIPQATTDQGHSRTRTTSSNVFPQAAAPSYPSQPVYQPAMTTTAYGGQPARRTLSNATTSTTSTTASGGIMPRTSSSLRRSSSGRSGGGPTSYVALMRKQKATVWCDRAQHEDPRILAAQRAAKRRAAQEVVGGVPGGSGGNGGGGATSSFAASSGGLAGGVRSKIRHHGAPKAASYTANLSGSGVPMRLSATEVDEGDGDDEREGHYLAYHHQRSGSGRSSIASSTQRAASSSSYAAYPHHGGSGRFSTSSTPPSGSGSSPAEGGMMGPDPEETPVPGDYGGQGGQRRDYFAHPTTTSGTGLSGGSGSSGERENSFGGLGAMPQRDLRLEEEQRKASEELRRRGSVDDRSMTMSGAVRLFVANPDLSD